MAFHAWCLSTFFLLVAGNWYRIFFHCDTGIKTQLALYPKFAEQNSIVTFIMCIRHIVWNPRSYVQWLSHQPMSWLPFISCCVLKGVSLFGEMKHEPRKWTSKNSRHVYVSVQMFPGQPNQPVNVSAARLIDKSAKISQSSPTEFQVMESFLMLFAVPEMKIHSGINQT